MLIMLMFLIDTVSAPAVLAYEKLKERNVPIVMTKHGNFYVWNEAAKISTQLSSFEVQKLSIEGGK